MHMYIYIYITLYPTQHLSITQQQASALSPPLHREEGKEEEAFSHQFMETEVYVDVGMVL